jgi:hypothetical protein
MLIIPVINEEIAQITAKTIGIEIYRLSNIVFPPVCPVETTILADIKNKKKTIISPNDYFPGFVLGNK